MTIGIIPIVPERPAKHAHEIGELKERNAHLRRELDIALKNLIVLQRHNDDLFNHICKIMKKYNIPASEFVTSAGTEEKP
jgi:hypothetical protein